MPLCLQIKVPANTGRIANAGLMLVHRLRRWPNIKPALAQRLVFVGVGCICCITRRHNERPAKLQQAYTVDGGPLHARQLTHQTQHAQTMMF